MPWLADWHPSPTGIHICGRAPGEPQGPCASGRFPAIALRVYAHLVGELAATGTAGLVLAPARKAQVGTCAGACVVRGARDRQAESARGCAEQPNSQFAAGLVHPAAGGGVEAAGRAARGIHATRSGRGVGKSAGRTRRDADPIRGECVTDATAACAGVVWTTRRNARERSRYATAYAGRGRGLSTGELVARATVLHVQGEQGATALAKVSAGASTCLAPAIAGAGSANGAVSALGQALPTETTSRGTSFTRAAWLVRTTAGVARIPV
jgi:hypothetical protein